MKKRYIEILGTNANNRGAELMAIAIKQRLQQKYPQIGLVVNSRFGSYLSRAEHGFSVTGHNAGNYVKRTIRTLFWDLMPSPLRQSLGIVKATDINLILDASGFAYSDQWGFNHTRRIVNRLNSKNYKNLTCILLPQALGTFNEAKVAKYSKLLFERAAIVYARDAISYEEATKLSPISNIKQCPDFTINVKADTSRTGELPKKFAALVPNVRMLDKTQKSDSYLNFMRHSIVRIKRMNLEPIFILHDTAEDQRVIDLIDSKSELKVYTDKDPRILKGMLGAADFVVGSRFHALVSALSQEVPCVGAGWSHKYPQLFNDFRQSAYLVNDFDDEAKTDHVFDRLMNSEIRDADQQALSESLRLMKEKVNEMWVDVETYIQDALK